MRTRFILGTACCFAFTPGLAFADETTAEGPQRAEAPSRAMEEEPLVEASPVRKNIGIALTAVGIVNMTAGAGVMLGFFFSGGGFGGVAGAIIGGPIHFEGSVLMAVGVPLWVTGGERVRRPAPAPAVPEVSVGPGTGSFTWSF